MTDRAIRIAGAAGAAFFAAVGAIFLFRPDAPIRLMNGLGRGFGLPEAAATGAGFYLALASAYMVLVTILAAGIARHPRNPIYPALLAQAKGASSLLSLGLFVFHQGALIYLANAVLDGGLALAAFFIALSLKRKPAGSAA